MMRTKPIQTTKWGTACAQCAAAKAKCSGRSGTGSKCDRCDRLLKQCTDQVHRPRKTRQPRQSQNPETGSPSVDMDSLVSTPEHPSSPYAGDSSSVGSQRPSSARQHVDAEFLTPFHTPNTTPFSLSPGSRHRDLVLGGREDAYEALLCKYRADPMPHHPFVIIPHHVSATLLRSRNPFLMLSIRAITSFEGLQNMHARMQQLTGYIADRVFRHAERSLDLLMGIVVMLGWHHYHPARQSQLNNLLCLAESLISDLGLNKRPPPNEGEQERTVEEKRLLLGVWHLRSSAAMHLQQLTSMPFTSYMRQCLVEIQEAKEDELDDTLVYFVKSQYLAERVAVLKSPQSQGAETTRQGDKENQERETALAGCQTYLERLVRELPNGLKENAMISTQFKTVALRLSEQQGRDVNQFSTPSSRPFPSSAPTINTLLPGATAPVRLWFQAWISNFPASQYHTLPSHVVLQLLYAVDAILRGQPSETLPSSPFQGQGSPISLSRPVSGAGSSLGKAPLGGVMTILDWLLALRASGPDIGKFWAALGESYDEEGISKGLASEAPSSPDDFPGGDGPYPAMTQDRHRSQTVPGLLDPFPILESQSGQPTYPTEAFIPPSRVGSVAPGQREYQSAFLLPPGAVSGLPTGPQLPPLHSGQWTAPAWDSDPSTWLGSSTNPSMVVTDEMDQQMWEPGPEHHSYDWGER